MKSYRKELSVEIPERMGFLNITPEVTSAIRESGIQEGLVLVNPMHITASVFVNDDERGLHHDYAQWLEKLAPHAPGLSNSKSKSATSSGLYPCERPAPKFDSRLGLLDD